MHVHTQLNTFVTWVALHDVMLPEACTVNPVLPLHLLFIDKINARVVLHAVLIVKLVVLDHTIFLTYNTISYHTISCHTISYHTIPYYSVYTIPCYKQIPTFSSRAETNR